MKTVFTSESDDQQHWYIADRGRSSVVLWSDGSLQQDADHWLCGRPVSASDESNGYLTPRQRRILAKIREDFRQSGLMTQESTHPLVIGGRG
jgi:hypothetical protein